MKILAHSASFHAEEKIAPSNPGIKHLDRFAHSELHLNTPYAEAARRLGLSPHEVLAVEDSRTGITSAVAAGLQCAAIGFDSGAGYVGMTRLCDLVGIASAN